MESFTKMKYLILLSLLIAGCDKPKLSDSDIALSGAAFSNGYVQGYIMARRGINPKDIRVYVTVDSLKFVNTHAHQHK